MHHQRSMVLARLSPGDRIGNYRVEAELGVVGGGVAYAAVHALLPRRAIVKVMHAALATHQPFALQLLREACILEALNHPGAPRVYDSGLTADRRPWFAIEHVAGGDPIETLADRLAARGPVTATEAAVLVRDLAEILEYAHRRGVVVRGLRPERIACAPRGELALCILDWSDARAHDAAARIPSLPAPAARPYLAPEQLGGGEVDDRADVYALGVIARALCDDLTDELAELVDQMVAADRFDRPSAGEVRARLDELLANVPGRPAVAPPRTRKPRWTPAFGAPAVATPERASVTTTIARLVLPSVRARRDSQG